MRLQSIILPILFLAAAALALAGCEHATRAEAHKTVPVSGPHFTDITQAAGIDYRWVIPGPRPLNILQTIGNGCAFLDYNNDGNLDILLVGTNHVALYQGDGHGHFTDVSHQTGLDRLKGHFLGCAVGDYDNDGFDDIYLSAYRGGALLHNEGGKGFRDVTQQAGIKPQPWTTSATFVDVDNDGLLDLFIGNYAIFGPNTQPQLCRQNGLETACGPRFYQPEKAVLYHNEGHGRFLDVTDRWKAIGHGKDLGVSCADFNGSGRQSIALANDEVPGDLLQNQGHVFVNRGAESGTAYDANGLIHGGMGVDWGDYDNDGRPDLVVATFQNEPKNVYHNEGGGFFNDRSAMLGVAAKTQPYVAFGVKWVDVDNDGWLDLILANGHVQDNIHAIDKSATYLQPIQLLLSRQGTAFEDVGAAADPAFSTPILGRGLAIGDIDNDGRMDALVVNSEGAPLLLHNETPNTGHWLLCRLEGVKSNRDGLGAQVNAEASGRKWLRLCHTDGSYMSASDKRVHFGLGAATQVTLTVHWPSGAVDVYPDQPADRVVTLREGAGKKK
ncbi:MAG TPA: CRTAC1 family protein [Chthonomonadaceae bacterium]|nr:CRTAC1 family protein [Chthonomonadaceae bacterium]